MIFQYKQIVERFNFRTLAPQRMRDLNNNLSETLKTLNLLIGDINAHPSRYINVTIFGRKNKDTH